MHLHTSMYPKLWPNHQPQRLYLRVQSQGSVQVPVSLWSPVAYLEEQPARIYVLGIIYGVLLVKSVVIHDWPRVLYWTGAAVLMCGVIWGMKR